MKIKFVRKSFFFDEYIVMHKTNALCGTFLNDIILQWKSQPSGVPDGDISMISYQRRSNDIRKILSLI